MKTPPLNSPPPRKRNAPAIDYNFQPFPELSTDLKKRKSTLSTVMSPLRKPNYYFVTFFCKRPDSFKSSVRHSSQGESQRVIVDLESRSELLAYHAARARIGLAVHYFTDSRIRFHSIVNVGEAIKQWKEMKPNLELLNEIKAYNNKHRVLQR